MPELTSQTVSIGYDAYGRPVTMTRRKNYDGKILWRIESAPINQRDGTLYFTYHAESRTQEGG